MKKFECLVTRGKVTKKIIRYFSDAEDAFMWLTLEWYKVIWIREATC